VVTVLVALVVSALLFALLFMATKTEAASSN
jgi:hypothetical protein